MKRTLVFLTMLVFGAGVYLSVAVAGSKAALAGDKCSEYFTNCTEGGCANMITAQNCIFTCETSDADTRIRCGEVDAVPTEIQH